MADLHRGKEGTGCLLCWHTSVSTASEEGRDAVDVTELEDGTGLRLSGELDLSSIDLLVDALDPKLAAGGRIVLDLTDLAFMDSTGLQVLIRSAITLGDRGTIVLAHPGNLVRSLLELAIRTDKLPNLVVEP
jgi:anti-anti-sigma factor